ncbi:hypothetical protein B0J12DRAFT_259093 [Macrophomina phaseolina]|uniref:Secreted protein n=1 Tax=Macrophomina phaseolina TaxID=35725 RepID=A0ABQ8FYU8_9PEZI|nr:hypothetical protein B0J12DRAFT_259093 [Macrophomina phaseolina]
MSRVKMRQGWCGVLARVCFSRLLACSSLEVHFFFSTLFTFYPQLLRRVREIPYFASFVRHAWLLWVEMRGEGKSASWGA